LTRESPSSLGKLVGPGDGKRSWFEEEGDRTWEKNGRMMLTGPTKKRRKNRVALPSGWAGCQLKKTRTKGTVKSEDRH